MTAGKPHAPTGATVESIPIAVLIASDTNPRKDFDKDDMAHLQASIAEKGITDPLTVRQRDGKMGFEIIDGERRYRAANALKLEALPCIVKEASDAEVVQLQLISHLQRKNIHPMEEARAFRSLFGDGKAGEGGIRAIAQSTGKPVHYVAQRMKLLDLTKEAQKLYSENVLTIDHATLLARLTEEDQAKALEFLVDEDFHEGNKAALSVKTLKAWIDEEVSLNLKSAPFDKADGELIPGVAACVACPKNSGFNTALFPELNAKDVCQDRACFNAKVAAYMERSKVQVRKEEKKPFIMISVRERMEQDDPLKVEGVKMSGRFKVVKPGNECKDTKRAEWIDGKDKGKRVLVCNYGPCPKHNKGASKSTQSSGPRDNYNSPANVLKRERASHEQRYVRALERICRDAIVSEMIAKGPQKLTLPVMREFVGHLIDPSRMESIEFLRLKFGIDKDPKNELLMQKIEKGSDLDLITVLTYAAMDEAFDTWQAEKAGKELERLAKLGKVDVGSIRKQATLLFETKVHRCEHCRCSEIHACDGGCRWNSQFEATGRFVCTKCVDNVKPLAAPKETKAEKPAAKKPKK